MANILVVDDEEGIRLVIEEYLTSEGHRVVQADDGTSGLKNLEDERFDIIITDIKMTKMDGFDFVPKIRRTKLNALTPVIVVSSYLKPNRSKRKSQGWSNRTTS